MEVANQQQAQATEKARLEMESAQTNAQNANELNRLAAQLRMQKAKATYDEMMRSLRANQRRAAAYRREVYL